MSYHISEYESFPNQGKEMNELMREFFIRVTPSPEFIAPLPLPNDYKDNVKIKPSVVFKSLVEPFFENVLEFDVKSSDVFVCSLPKCGSSWMQTIVWLLTHNLNYDAAQTMDRRAQLGDFDEILNAKLAQDIASELQKSDKSKSLDGHTALKLGWAKVFEKIDAPRVLKTHFPVYFLPKAIWSTEAKIIYVVRNPKDMIVSLYHFMRNFFFADITVDDMVNASLNDAGMFAPYLDHIIDFWRIKHLPNVLFVNYEDVVKNPFETIKKISEFLQCNYSDKQLEKLEDFVSFANMKKNNSINREHDIVQMEKLLEKKRIDPNFTFLRKGKAGGYRDDLTDEHIKKLDEWINKELKRTDFRFKN